MHVTGGSKPSVLLLAFGVLLAPPARAAEALRFSLEYDAPASCPDAAAFTASILARAPGSERTADRGTAQVAFDAHITEAAGRASGYLLVRLASGATSRRDVPEASCAEVAASMSAIAALVIEGTIAPVTAEGAPAAASVAPAPVVPPAVAPQPKPPPVTRPEAPPAVRPAPAPAPLARPAPAPSKPSPWRAGPALGVAFETGAGPSLVPGIGFGVDISADRDEVLAPRARLTGLYIASERGTADGTARFRWLAARLALSPLRWQRGPFTARPVLELDAGDFEARGENTRNGQTQSLLWLAAGPALHLEAGLGRVVVIEAQLGVRALAKNDQFVFLPDTEAFEMPRVSYGALLGLAARLP